MLYILGSFLISMLCGFISIPMILKFCKERQIYDLPNARKVHTLAVPRLGGISFFPSMGIAFVIALVVSQNFNFKQQFVFSPWTITFFISLILIYCIGIIDDLTGLRPRTKFIAQIIAASLLPLSNLYINNLYGFLGFYEIPAEVGIPLTVLSIVFINNAMNLIDGIDGLCGGLSLIISAGFLYCFYSHGFWIYCMLISSMMGILIAFLYFNVFGSQSKGRKIFMGDSGSLSLGFIFGFLLVKFSMDNPDVMPFRKDSLLLSCSLLIVPVFDVFRIIMVRFMHHKPLFGADKNHIHHKLLRAGMSHHQALLALLGLAIFLILTNKALSSHLDFSTIVICDIVIWTIFDQLTNRSIRKRGEQIFYKEEQDVNN